MAAKAKRKQKKRRRQPGTPATAPATEPASGGGSTEGAKPTKRLERRVSENRAQDAKDQKTKPHALDVRYGVVRPKPVWSPFPLTEIALVIGIGMFATGFIMGTDGGGAALIGAGALIATVVVFEMCLREHLGGFKSHSLLLGFLPVVVVHSFVYFVITDSWIGPTAVFVDATFAAMFVLMLHGQFKTAHRKARDRAAASRA